MQIKIFTIPILGGEWIVEELNKFLRAKKILGIESQLVSDNTGTYWSFCVRYLDGLDQLSKPRIDYREQLDPDRFGRFANMRELRKKIAQEEGVPAFAIFTDEELAKFAAFEKLTIQNMQSVKGIGEKKIQKYGQQFVKYTEDEAPGKDA